MAPKDDDGASSERSGTSGADTASQGSSHKSDLKALRREKHGNEEEQDLLEQKKSFIEGVYSCMYTLVRQSALSSWKFAVLKIFLEGLMAFIVVFNPSMAAWVIDTNNPVWQIVRWVLWRSPIMRLYGYDTYIRVMYVMVAIVYLAVLGLVWLTLAMRKQEQSKWLKHAAVSLHVLFDLVFIMLVGRGGLGEAAERGCGDHVYFVGVECLKMPHILHMAVAIITAALFFCVTALLLVASSDLNPVSRGYLASPAAITRLRILAAKAFYVIVADDMQSWPKPQALFLAGAVGFIVYWNLKRVPFYRTYVNGVWTGIWFGVLYTALLLVYIAFGHHKSVDQRRVVTLWVLYGIFPVVVGTSVLSYWRARLALHPASKFEALEPGVKISKVHKFGDPMEVEVLARVMRQYNNDGDVTEEAAALGEKVVRAGMMVFPNNPTLLILYANFLLEVRKDGPAARTQLQLASKHSPTLLQRYQIFCTGEASKKLKDSQDGGMDLQAYIEFRRNFRAVLRVHKEVLLLQAELWQLMMRVLERYPNNGKLLRCYGKFLEDVKHDPATAARVYGEASRNGGGDAILNLDLSAIQSAADKPDFLTSMSMEDDAVIVINAEGTIMMCSQAVNSVFGYAKNELEGMNVSLLMPQPFSQRHPSYLSRYVNGGEPHILDTVREVVGLHKDRFVFPLSLCVTKMSGTGTDSVFLGVARPMASNSLNVRAWIAPNGVFLCGDTQFASMCGIAESELVGCTLEGISLTAAVEVQQLLEQCRAASEVELASGVIRASLVLRHRYMDTVPVDVVVGIAGTDAQRIYVLDCTRADKATNVLVVDHHMRLRFASTGVSALLGYPARRLATMRLDQLLPAPYNTLHAKWTQNPPPNIPPTSCRAGKVVHLLNEAGSAVPVRIKVSAATGSGGGVNDANIGALNVVQIEKVSMEEQLEEKRWVLTADIRGRIRSVSRPDSELFDFAGADLVGCSLCDTIDIFAEWRERNGESQLQLLMLALLDKEHEMPGTSWRVRVRAPATVAAPHLPAVPGAPGVSKHSIASKSACLQVELHDAAEAGSAADGSEAAGNEGEGEGATLVAVTLWRRDLLSGVVELDEGLVVRRASPMTGLIVGVPAGAMMRKPIQKFLDMPIDIAWDDLVAQFARKGHGTKQRPALKGAASSRGTVSPVMPFIGPHPDTGTMRILTQGVSVLAPGGRPKITLTLHPDTTFAGAHANLMRVLHLDGGSQDGAAGGEATAGEHSAAAGNGAATAGADAQRQRSMRKSMSKKATDASRDEAPAAAGGNDTPTRAPAATSDEDGEDRDTNEQGTPKDGVEGMTQAAVAAAGRQAAQAQPGAIGGGYMKPPPFGRIGSMLGNSGLTMAGVQQDWEHGSEAASSASGSQAASGFTSVTDASGAGELVIDSRRGRLLKALQKLVCGPMLMEPLEKLRKHTYAIFLLMLITHVVTYVVVSNEIKSEHHDVNLVHRQALAMDRSQLIAVRAMMGAFCERPNVTLKVSVCANTLNYTIGKLQENIALMVSRRELHSCVGSHPVTKSGEQYRKHTSYNRITCLLAFWIGAINEAHHQYVYLGDNAAATTMLMDDVYNIWTSKSTATYNTFLDTSPPRIQAARAGVWVLGNRFIAAAREAVYWLPVIKEQYRLHRTFNFLVDNGIGPLFEVYAKSLDLLVNAAWKSVDRLRLTLIVLLVVEALVIQMSCLVYEWVLVQRLESSRLVAILAMLGLPGPILRQLATKEAKSVRHADSGDAAGGGANGADGAVARRQSRLLPESDPELMKISSGGGMLDDGGARSRLVAGSGRVSGRRGAAARTMRGLRVNGKTLRPSFVNVTKFMLPFVAWNIALVIVYAISLVQLEGLQGPLASLNMASHIIYRYTRVRAIAFGYVSQDEDASRDIWRDMLATELRYFDSEYNALMYGGTPITQTSAVFNHPVPPSTFFSSAFATEFFRSKRCFRFDQEACLKPGDQYYEVTHNGLDVMVRRMLAEMRLLSEDADADVAYTSTRYLYMYHVGARDLYEGLQQAAQLFVDYSISRYNQVVDIHTILLICTIVGICAYMVLILWPHLARLKADAMRQSALLSHVPPELDCAL
eukprot:XP_001694823.1 predicted protein [Chlamydomonas reinhardtii]